MKGGPEIFYNAWEMILSRRPEVIRKVFYSLDEEEKAAVLEHLQKMQSEPGWQPGQRASAHIALEAILDTGDTGSD